jgi:glycosyltransferase involved in cell wall biosynthesis
LHEQGLDFEWQFIGQIGASPYGRAFLERIKPMEQAGYARYLGMKSVSELIERFDRSAALIHFPSEEAFGLVVAEALARGLKLFGIRAGGVADIAEGIHDAELFSVDDWNGLTAGISEWMHEGWPRAKSGSEVMRARYHPDVIARRHLEIYREVLSTVS